jgi:hypothetical protein
MAQLLIPIVVGLSFLARFALDVSAVIVALWIWNRWPALGLLPGARRVDRVPRL